MEDWTDSEIAQEKKFVKLHNWRGINLLPLASKILSKIIHRRLTEILDKHIRQEKAGFQPEWSCPDHIFTLRQILKQSSEWSTPSYANFMDLEKAFDSIYPKYRGGGGGDTVPQWSPTHTSEHSEDVIQWLFITSDLQQLFYNELTEAFDVSTRVKQGCILSPFSSFSGWTGSWKMWSVKKERYSGPLAPFQMIWISLTIALLSHTDIGIRIGKPRPVTRQEQQDRVDWWSATRRWSKQRKRRGHWGLYIPGFQNYN